MSRLKITLLLSFFIYSACSPKIQNSNLMTHPKVKAFIQYFYMDESAMVFEKSESLDLLPLGSQANKTLLKDICSAAQKNFQCNATKEYILDFTPDFSIEQKNGRNTITELSPDSFADLLDIKKSKWYRLDSRGSDGSIYETFWYSAYSFVIYGMDSDGGFLTLFNLKKKTRKIYSFREALKKQKADPDIFLLSLYSKPDN